MMYTLLQNYFTSYLGNDFDSSVIREHYTPKIVKRKELILTEGDVVNMEAFVCEGAFKLFNYNEKGDEQILYFALENWWMTDMDSFLHKTPSMISIQALEDSLILTIDRENKEALLKKIPKLERVFRLMIQKGNIALQRRLLSIMGKNAEQRYLELIEKYPYFEQRFTQQQLAAYLGISQEFLSKIKKKINKKE